MRRAHEIDAAVGVKIVINVTKMILLISKCKIIMYNTYHRDLYYLLGIINDLKLFNFRSLL